MVNPSYNKQSVLAFMPFPLDSRMPCISGDMKGGWHGATQCSTDGPEWGFARFS